MLESDKIFIILMLKSSLHLVIYKCLCEVYLKFDFRRKALEILICSIRAYIKSS